jgi:peptide/nickel transport system substrate-binding protein
VADGVDLKTKPVGAGPFVLKSWLKDDTMTLARNPNWFDAPRPYLDQLVFKILGDENQRINTFVKGDLQAFYTGINDSATTAQQQVKGAAWTKVVLNTGTTYVFNNTKPPFDDFRIRKFFVEGLDRVAMDHDTLGAQAVPTTTWISKASGSKYFDPNAVIPPYNPTDAQAQIDSYVKDHGGPVKINFQAFPQTSDQDRAKYIQAQLNTYKNVQVTVTVGDSPSNITRVLQKDYMVSSWGFPFLDPEPSLYAALHSKGYGNYSGYHNDKVDAALDAARATEDVAERQKQYNIVQEQAARDLPYFPYNEQSPGWVSSPKLQGMELYDDGIVRFDLVNLVK